MPSNKVMKILKNVPQLDKNETPEWCFEEYKYTLNTACQISSKICTLQTTIRTLENHIRDGTVPKSLKVNVMDPVHKTHQEEMDKALGDAKKGLQASVLKSLLHARKQKLGDR